MSKINSKLINLLADRQEKTMTLEERMSMLEATIASLQVEIAELHNPAIVNSAIQNALRPGGAIHSIITGNGWSLRVKEGKISQGDAGVFGGTVTAAQNEAAKTHEEIFNEKLDLIISLMPPLKL
ncbi:hypothetical protein [Escherichia coli]|uniref:hypothetical protein n=1 Tax=Escherichia coli TaxID=562 RepID=UPI002018F30E|nr:hypothetical protein [Escherichia coli]